MALKRAALKSSVRMFGGRRYCHPGVAWLDLRVDSIAWFTCGLTQPSGSAAVLLSGLPRAAGPSVSVK